MILTEIEWVELVVYLLLLYQQLILQEQFPVDHENC